MFIVTDLVSLMTTEAVQAQATTKYIMAVGMTRQSLILRVRGSLNMHWLMTCFSVTCAPRNVAVTSLHTGQVIQQQPR